jgi:Mce-associated membrane protein
MHVADEEVAVPSFRRRASVMDDAKSVAQSPQDAERSTDALASAEEAEAEAAEAEAVAAAARARAKAIRLRKQADTDEPSADETADSADAADSTDSVAEPETDGAADDEPVDVDEAEAAPAPKKSRRLRMPKIRWGIVAAVLAILCISALVTLSVLMVVSHREQTREQQRTAEYAAAARQSVVTLMSLNFNNAQEDVQRIIENTTGQFKADFEAQAEAFAQVARDSKVVTEVTVNVAAIKSSTDTSATALVSATSRVSNSAGATQEPRSWRLLVDLVREGDQIKMSKVEFVP